VWGSRCRIEKVDATYTRLPLLQPSQAPEFCKDGPSCHGIETV
jgi:hypothetical protein